jgi:hypothetical protein
MEHDKFNPLGSLPALKIPGKPTEKKEEPVEKEALEIFKSPLPPAAKLPMPPAPIAKKEEVPEEKVAPEVEEKVAPVKEEKVTEEEVAPVKEEKEAEVEKVTSVKEEAAPPKKKRKSKKQKEAEEALGKKDPVEGTPIDPLGLSPVEPLKKNEDFDIKGMDAVASASAEVALSKKGINLSALEYKPDNSMSDMLEAAQVLVDSGVLPNHITEPSQVVAMSKLASELKISPMIAMKNLDMIEGEPTLNVHLVGALLKRNNIHYTCIEDCVSLGEGTNNWRTTFQFFDMNLIRKYQHELLKMTDYPEAAHGAYMKSLEPLQQVANHTFSFTYGEAYHMGLTERKSWVRMKEIMMRSRCLTIGGRLFAPDALNGMYETSEMAEVKNKVYAMTEDGEAIIVD